MKKSLQKIWTQIKNWAMGVKLPLFEGFTLYDVSSFFFEGIAKGRITQRAGSVAYSFFLALFPGIIFFFSLIPYFPIEELQHEIYEVFRRILPPDTYNASRSTIEDVLSNRRGGLLSFGFIFALIFATNGLSALINNFNQTIHEIESRGFWRQKLVSLGLTFILSFNFITGMILIIFSSDILNGLLQFFRLEEISPLIIELSRFGLLVFLIFMGIVLLYNYGPAKTREWQFFSPGAILATFLILVSSAGFSFYVNNFSQYNKLYGSIGTLIVILLWIYINAVGLIVGFELNASIAQVKYTKKQQELNLDKK